MTTIGEAIAASDDPGVQELLKKQQLEKDKAVAKALARHRLIIQTVATLDDMFAKTPNITEAPDRAKRGSEFIQELAELREVRRYPAIKSKLRQMANCLDLEIPRNLEE